VGGAAHLVLEVVDRSMGSGNIEAAAAPIKRLQGPLPLVATPVRFGAMADFTPRLFYDYIDPLSFLIEHDVLALESEGWTTVSRQPLELRAPPAALIDPRDPLWQRRWDQASTLADERGIALHRPTLVPWSRKAHELAMHAREKDRFAEAHAALYRAHLLEGRDIGRVDVLVEIAGTVGLDPQEARIVLGVDRHAATLDGLRGEAERLGVRGVPTLLVAGERIEGVLPREALRALLEASEDTATETT
jgi:predicted DsbA family dithiol-disulfide isomerase